MLPLRDTVIGPARWFGCGATHAATRIRNDCLFGGLSTGPGKSPDKFLLVNRSKMASRPRRTVHPHSQDLSRSSQTTLRNAPFPPTHQKTAPPGPPIPQLCRARKVRTCNKQNLPVDTNALCVEHRFPLFVLQGSWAPLYRNAMGSPPGKRINCWRCAR